MGVLRLITLRPRNWEAEFERIDRFKSSLELPEDFSIRDLLILSEENRFDLIRSVEVLEYRELDDSQKWNIEDSIATTDVLEKYSMYKKWDEFTAVSLLLEKNPKNFKYMFEEYDAVYNALRITVGKRVPETQTDELIERYEYIQDLISNTDLPSPTSPKNWMIWAESMKIKVPSELKKFVKENHVEDNNLSQWPWGTYSTPNIEHLKAAVENFWEGYDPDEPSRAHKNEVIADWLVAKRNVKKSLALKIAQIIRHPDIPSGPRKKLGP